MPRAQRRVIQFRSPQLATCHFSIRNHLRWSEVEGEVPLSLMRLPVRLLAQVSRAARVDAQVPAPRMLDRSVCTFFVCLRLGGNGKSLQCMTYEKNCTRPQQPLPRPHARLGTSICHLSSGHCGHPTMRAGHKRSVTLLRPNVRRERQRVRAPHLTQRRGNLAGRKRQPIAPLRRCITSRLAPDAKLSWLDLQAIHGRDQQAQPEPARYLSGCAVHFAVAGCARMRRMRGTCCSRSEDGLSLRLDEP